MPIPGFCGNIRKVNAQQIVSISQSKTPQGICGVVAMPTQVFSAELPENCGRKIVLLEEIQDPGNVGTLIRSAAAFNFSGVLLSETCADPFSPKAVQASAGSLLSVWIRRTAEYITLASALKKNGFTIIAADIRGTISREPLEKKKLVLALGNEGKGISQVMRDLADTVFTIPCNMQAVESLNVASAGAISMFLVNRENAS